MYCPLPQSTAIVSTPPHLSPNVLPHLHPARAAWHSEDTLHPPLSRSRRPRGYILENAMDLASSLPPRKGRMKTGLDPQITLTGNLKGERDTGPHPARNSKSLQPHCRRQINAKKKNRRRSQLERSTTVSVPSRQYHGRARILQTAELVVYGPPPTVW